MSVVLTKKCSMCKQEKTIDMFGTWEHKEVVKPKCRCRKCEANANKMWRESHPEEQKERTRSSVLKRKYGITDDIYNKMLMLQDSKCAICGKTYGYIANGVECRLGIDHDHSDGSIRGLLCASCNIGIGNFYHNKKLLETAIIYIEAGKDYRVRN